MSGQFDGIAMLMDRPPQPRMIVGARFRLERLRKEQEAKEAEMNS